MFNNNKSKPAKQFVRSTLLMFVGALALTLSVGAHAQWKWIDSRGVTQYSDTPPPRTIPEGNILRRPDGSVLPVGIKDPEPAATNPVTPATGEMSPEEKALEDKRKEQEAQEAQKRAEQEAANAAQKQEACESATRSLQTLNSGIRIRMLDDKGNPYYLDDQQITEKRRAAQERVNRYCN